MASAKVRELEDNLIFKQMTTAAADKTAVDFLSKPDRMTSKDVHSMLMAAGFTPGLGNIADAADALLYAAEGEYGAAGLSAAAMIPFIGQAVSAKKALKIARESGEKMQTLFRGSEGWHRGSMVKKGKFVGGKDFPDMLWMTDKKSIAGSYAQKQIPPELLSGDPAKAFENIEKWRKKTDKALLEFEIPESYLKKNFRNVTGLDRPGQLIGFFQGGLPKEFLKKVHK